MRKLLFTFILFFSVTSCFSQIWNSPVREIPNYKLNDIAMASADNDGFVIYYNPAVVKEAGPLVSAFFRAHEYAHIYLGHVTRLLFSTDPFNRLWISRESEIEADEYATNMFCEDNPDVLDATIKRFTLYPNTGDNTHLPSTVRAQNIHDLCNEFNNHNYSDKDEYEDCPTCYGSGTLSSTTICLYCNGGGTKNCPTCFGRGGYYYGYYWYMCSTCSGIGAISCYSCFGSGVKAVEEKCYYCNGKGFVKN